MTHTSTEKENSATNQKIKEKFVNREVYANVNQMVAFILNAESTNTEKPFVMEDIENFETYPEYFGKFIKFKGGTEEDHQEEIDRLHLLLDEKGQEHEDTDEIWDEISELENLGPEPQEIFEWWLITGWLANKLAEKGEPVIHEENIWGRTATGQAIFLDGVITDICSDMGILVGQENEWKL